MRAQGGGRPDFGEDGSGDRGDFGGVIWWRWRNWIRGRKERDFDGG